MSESEGFIKIYRSFIKWEWYTDSNTKAVFFHCLLKANWKDGRYKGHDVPRGSFVTGRKQLAKELKLSEQEIRTALTHLQTSGEITIKATNKFSIITVEKWAFFQSVGEKATNNSTINQPTTNHNRRNKEKKERKNIYSASNRFNNFEQRKINFKELEV